MDEGERDCGVVDAVEVITNLNAATNQLVKIEKYLLNLSLKLLETPLAI